MNNELETQRQLEEQQGVKMIIALQKMAGIDEPEERALKNWRAFSESEKQATRNIYNLLFEEDA